MMKKYFYSLFAVLSMLWTVTSCSQEEVVGGETSGDEVVATFNLDMEGQQASRAIGDGLTVNELVFAVFDMEGNEIESLGKTVAVSNKGAVVNVRLVKGQKYQFVFWAQKAGNVYYDTEDMAHIKLKPTEGNNYALNNDEDRDAFYAHEGETLVTGSFNKNITLKRPFAQLNLATTADDIKWAANAGVAITQSSVTVKGLVYSQLNTLTGYCSKEVEAVMEMNVIPSETEKLTIKDTENQFALKDYYYLSTSYLLVSAKDALSEEIVFTLNGKVNGGEEQTINELTVVNAPLQRNWRTNIVGEILTGEGTFNIVIDPIFDADRNYPMNGSNLNIWDGTSTKPELKEGTTNWYLIDEASDWVGLADMDEKSLAGATFELTKDLSFKNVEWDSRAGDDKKGDTTPNTIKPLFETTGGGSLANITFLGNDHVIRDFIIEGDNALNSLFGCLINATVSNLTIINADVKGVEHKDYRAAILAAKVVGGTFENITVKDSKLTGVQKIGGLIGYAENGTTGVLNITNCTIDGLSLTNHDITGESGSTGGLVGCLNSGTTTIQNSYVKNSALNLIHGDEPENLAKRANSEFIGVIRGGAKVNLVNCGVGNVTLNNSREWEAYYPQFVGGNVENSTLTVNGKNYPETEEDDIPGDYIEKDGYLEVYTAEGLLKWAYRVNKGENTLGLQLMRDITLPNKEIAEDATNGTYVFTDTEITVDADGKPSGSNWVPVLSVTEEAEGYCGQIEGNNKTISGLTIVRDEMITGMIGLMYGGASVKNLKFEAAYIKGGSYTGVVCGYSQHGNVVENVHVINSNIIGGTNVGGIVGLNYRRHIKADGTVYNEKLAYVSNCTIDAKSSVVGNQRVGGICGKNYGAVIIACTNNADVTGNELVGGIVGRFRSYGNDASGFIIACNTTENATIKSDRYAGGITGYILRNDEHTNCASYIVTCSSTSKIEGTYRGAIVGQTAEDADDPIATWALKNGADKYKYNKESVETPASCRLVESISDFSIADIEAMNNAIDEFNNDKPEGITCPYQWSWTEGSWPVLVQK